MIMMLILLGGCHKNTSPEAVDQESAVQMLNAMESYEAGIQITFYSNKGENVYVVAQKAAADGKYRMEIQEPAQFAGVLTVCDGTQILQSDPTIGGAVQAKQTPVRDALLLFSFVEAMKQSDVSFEETPDGLLVLETEYPGDHQKIAGARLTLKKGTGTPLSLEVFDREGNPSLHMEYLTFQMNPEFGEKDFVIEEQKES